MRKVLDQMSQHLSATDPLESFLAAAKKTNGLLEKLIKINEEQKKAIDKQVAFGA